MDAMAALKAPAGKQDAKAAANAVPRDRAAPNDAETDAGSQAAASDASALMDADRKAAELKSEILKAVQPSKDASPQPHIEVRRTGAGTLDQPHGRF